MKYLAIAAALLASTSAQAADVTATPYNWSGAYIGIQAGGRWAEESISGHFANGVSGWDVKPSGGLIGGYAGYNHQISNIVIGVEVGVAFNNISDYWFLWPLDYKSSAEQLISVNARLGYALDRTLFYGTAGYTKARYKFEIVSDFHDYDIPPEKYNRNGYNIGAGIEYAFTDNIIARAEYRYFNFGKVTYQGDGGQAKYKQQTAILGLAYKF